MGAGASSSGSSKEYYADIAAVLCAGPVDRLEAIHIDGKKVWPESGPGLDRAGQPNPVAVTVPTHGTVWFYWGEADQVLDPTGEAFLSAQGHPPYRRQAVAVLKAFLFGANRTSAPNLEFVIRRRPRQDLITGSAAELDADGQANPLCILAELLTDPVHGLGLPSTLFDQSSWQATAEDLYASAALTYLSPAFESAKSARARIDEVREYYDGWFRWSPTGRIVAGRYLHDVAPPAFTSANTVTADDLTEEADLDAEAWADTRNEAVVKFTNGTAEFKDDSFTATAGFNRAVVGEPRQESLDRPYITRAAQAARHAAEFLKVEGEPAFAGKLTVRGVKAAALPVGTVFRFVHDVLGLDLIARVTGRLFSGPPAETGELSFSTERGLAAVRALPGATDPATPADPAAERVPYFQFLHPPSALFGDNYRLLILCARTAAVTVGVRAWFQQADASQFQDLGTQAAVAVTGLLVAAYPAADGDDNTEALRFTLRGSPPPADLEVISEGQTEDQVDDGTLLLFIFSAADPSDYEILAVRGLRLSGGQWLAQVRRAQCGTRARSFAASDLVWVIRRDNLRAYTHESFPGLFRAEALATFRLQGITPFSEADLTNPDTCPDISYTFREAYPVGGPRSLSVASTATVLADGGVVASITASWLAPLDSLVVDGGTIQTEYQLTSDTDWTPGPVVAGDQLKAVIGPVRMGLVYRVRVRSVLSVGASSTWSVSGNITAAGDTTAPAVPASLVAEAMVQGIRLTWVNTTDADLSHTDVLEQSAVTPTPSGGTTPSFRLMSDTFTRTGLAIGTTRFYWVRAVDASGNASAWAGPVSATALAVDVSWINGQLQDAQIAALAASKVTGQLTNDQLAAIAAAKVTGQLTSAQIADLAAAKLTGQIAETQVADDAISTPKLAAGAVSTAKLAAGAVVAEKLAVGIGAGNLFSNSAPVRGAETIDWFSGFNTTGITPVVAAGFDPWRPLGGASVYIRIPGTPAAGALFDLATLANGERIAVRAGQRYEASAYLSCHRCYGYVNIAWYDSAGAYMTENAGSAVTTAGSGSLAGWGRSTGLFVAPAGAVTALFYARGNADGGADPFIFLSNAYFAEALPNQTACSPWSPAGPATLIDGRGIRAETVAAAQIAAGAVVTEKLAADSVTAAKVAAGAIETAKLAAGAVVADKVAAGAIVAEKIAANNITADHIGTNLVITSAANIGTAVITAAKIGDLEVSTIKVANNAITHPFVANQSGIAYLNNTSFVTLASVASVPASGSTVVVTTSASLTNNSSASRDFVMETLRDSTVLDTVTHRLPAGYDTVMTRMMLDSGASGTHTYSAQVRITSTPGSSNTVWAEKCVIQPSIFKK